MRVGVPTEVKTDEYRVALTPAGVRELVDAGHEVLVQRGAGEGSAIADDDYAAQGARIAADADAVFDGAELIVKVKEPQPQEVARLRSRHLLFTYLHLAPAPELTRGLMASGATCVAYETVEDGRGRLPLLAPMSEVAGKLATQAGAFMLEKPLGGRGILLGGVPGVAAANVLVIGGGTVGMRAALIAIGMEATVFVYDRDIERLRELDRVFGGRADTCFATTLTIEQRLPEADLVIGAVLVHGAKAPRVIARRQLALMKPGAVLVDVSIDQGGCFESSRPTTHSDPTYEVDGIAHYCVANMPGAVPITATHALTNATLPYVRQLADVGVQRAAQDDPGLAKGLNVVAGAVTYAPVAEAVGAAHVPVEEALGAARAA
ncbi:alanine dehydrogenase [Pseudonocardia sp. DLS-67]